MNRDPPHCTYTYTHTWTYRQTYPLTHTLDIHTCTHTNTQYTHPHILADAHSEPTPRSFLQNLKPRRQNKMRTSCSKLERKQTKTRQRQRESSAVGRQSPREPALPALVVVRSVPCHSEFLSCVLHKDRTRDAPRPPLQDSLANHTPSENNRTTTPSQHNKKFNMN